MSQFNIFNLDEYRQQTWTCDYCGWTGLGSELEVGEVFEALHELNCPQCQTCMGCVTSPSVKWSRANWDNLSVEERLHVEHLERMTEEFDRLCLKTPNQLPEITAPGFKLVWDGENDRAVIKHEGQVVFSEPIRYDDPERFETVVGILKSRYGDALQGVKLTPVALDIICGDKLGALSRLKTCHAKLFGNDVICLQGLSSNHQMENLK